MTIQAVPRHANRLLMTAGGACTVLTAVLAFNLEHSYGSTVVQAWAWGAVAPLYLVGLLAVIVRPDHLSARWLGAAGSLIAIETVARRLLPQLGDLNAGWWVANATFLQVAILATAASIASVLVVFPDDHYRYPYQKRVLLTIWLFAVVVPATLLVSRPSLHFFPSWAGPDVVNPMYVAFLAPLGGVAEVAYNWRVVLWAVGVAAMVARYRRGSPEARRQFRWPLVAAVTLTLLDTTYRSLEQLDHLPAALGTRLVFFGLVPGLVLLSFSILAALARHRLIGIELWLRRLILFGGASTVIALAYLGLAGSVGWAAGRRLSVGVGVVVTLAAVVAFYPARRRLDAWARHRVFGRSVAGAELLRRVGAALQDAHDVRHLGSNLVGTVVDGLELEWARLSLSATGTGPSYPVAASGVGHDDAVVPDLVVPLTSGDETVGFLECGAKRDGELTTADEALVATVARQAALAVRNVRLASELESRLDELRRQAEELTASRSRLLHAQMEERHRIERNIHDGVQQEIIASIAKVRLARNQLARDRGLAESTLAGLQDDNRRMLDNLRELSRGIHPSVLTHRGLVEALRTQAALLPIDIHVDVAAELRNARFAADVEEAAYYVVSEGLTNVLKHAHTGEATVQLAIDDGQLTVEVIDHGRGCISGPAPGSGIIGLRDRLGPIGGELRLDARPGDGTTLRATLPIHVAERHG